MGVGKERYLGNEYGTSMLVAKTKVEVVVVSSQVPSLPYSLRFAFPFAAIVQ